MDTGPNGSREAPTPSRARVLLRLMAFVAILGAVLLSVGGRLDWVFGWLYVAMYASMAVVGVLVVPMDPGLLAERTRARPGVKKWDRNITIIGSLLYPLAILIVAGLDTRMGWTPRMPVVLQSVALAAAAGGTLISTWAASVNRFYSRFVRIQTERGHIAVADGPYRYVRHPGYLGQIIFSLASSVALGSVWSLIPAALFAVLLVVRTSLEDKTLQDELEGYKEYTRRTTKRLLPYIW